MKHTPGPWKIIQAGRISRDIAGAEHSGFMQQWVATVFSEAGAEQTEADARLIAAAPELLEACEALKAWYEDDEAAPFDAPMSLIDAAIAKAKGES